jgi:xanthine/uracil permease
MSIGHVFFFITLIFFFLAGTGVTVPYGACIAWGLFCCVLGFLLSGMPLSWPVRPPT